MDFGNLVQGITESIIYSVIGILVMAMCYFVIDKMTDFSIKKELIEDENIALGVMFAGFFISVAIIIMAAITG